MIILGIHDGHDAGATLLKDGKIIAAINEERLNRKKLYTGMPERSIYEILKISKIDQSKIDHVAIAGTSGLMANLGWEEISLKKKTYQSVSNLTTITSQNWFPNIQRMVFNKLRDKTTEKYLKKLGLDCDVSYFDHHKCHVSTAYYKNKNNKCLIFTSDGSGDALSASVYIGENGELEKVIEIPTFHSIGYFYGYITMMCGFKMFKHEGKITGLAAYGDPNKCYRLFENYFGFENGQLVNKLGLIGHPAIERMKKDLAEYKKEDWAAAVQKRLEDVMCAFVKYYVEKCKINDIALAGGVFANVKLNQRISELPEVNSIFIYPNMGDGGLSTGAALNAYAKYCLEKGESFKPYELEDIYFGPEFSNEDIEKAITNFGLKGEYIKNIEKYTAELISKKKIVGHFAGRMEYGPRALGNRSILADPTDRTINDWLNKRLKRTEFMPFAPSALDTCGKTHFENYEKGDYPSEFMTITFNCNKPVQIAKAVVNIDNTARPQIVKKERNAKYYQILKNYENLTNLPLFVNTSFNIHEEPIVCTPEDAIRSFQQNCVDVLIMENWILKH